MGFPPDICRDLLPTLPANFSPTPLEESDVIFVKKKKNKTKKKPWKTAFLNFFPSLFLIRLRNEILGFSMQC